MPTLSDHEILSELDDRMQNFVRRQEMLFVATGEPDDGHDCTFVTGGAGFVRVLDVNRLAWPEFDDPSATGDDDRNATGFDNRSATGFDDRSATSEACRAISRDPRVSLLFVDFARGAIGLHINGKAKVIDDDAMRRAYRSLNLDPTLDLIPDRRPARWITVYVEGAYLSAAGEL